MASPATPPTYRTGMFSLFLVVTSAVFATGSWTWLVILAAAGGEVSARHILAAAVAVTTTVVAVLLAVRVLLQREAAEQHADVRRLLVDISWNAFAAAGNAGHAVDVPGRANVVPFPSGPYDANGGYDLPAASLHPFGRREETERSKRQSERSKRR